MEEKKAESNVYKEILSWVKAIALALAVALVIRFFLFEPMTIPSGSMLDTLQIGDRIYVNKFIYKLTPIKRGDIVVFWYPDNPSVRYVKRAVGLGGDVVEIKKGRLYVNGVVQNEPYLKEPMRPEDFGPYKVPADHYFMMGDNRNDSLDSRYWNNKYVDKSAVIGKPVFIYFPLNRIGVIKTAAP
ncbi:MAG: signal peptidase I [Clostridiales bacterium]|jgi:signal peptidase I|nr:signal peptidase I [Eubacteriales bacterium]MDH7565408.1 signal peptidase I [Clostridiales bacterium]